MLGLIPTMVNNESVIHQAGVRVVAWFDPMYSTWVGAKIATLVDRKGGHSIDQATVGLRAPVSDTAGHGYKATFNNAEYYQTAALTTLGSGTPTREAIIMVVRDTTNNWRGAVFAYGNPGGGLWGSIESGNNYLALAGKAHAIYSYWYDNALSNYPAGNIAIGSDILSDVPRTTVALHDTISNPDLFTISDKNGTVLATNVAGNAGTPLNSIQHKITIGASEDLTHKAKAEVYCVLVFTGDSITLTQNLVNSICAAVACMYGTDA